MIHARFRSAHRQAVAAFVGLISLSAPGLPAQERPREAGAVDAPAGEAQSQTRVFFVGRLPVWDVAGRREVREGDIDTAVLRRLQSRIGVAQPAVAPLSPTNTLNVDTTVDNPALSGCLDVGPPDCSLRGAVARANTLSGGTQINVPAGTYMLSIPGGSGENPFGDNSIGDLDVMASDVSIVGAGAATTIIQQTQPNDRVLEVNPGLSAGFVFSLSGVTIRGGRETTGVGGGGIISGSTGNQTTISNCRFTDNQASGAPGGAILNGEGTLTVSGSTFDTNTATGLAGDGGAILFDGISSPSNFTVTNSTFSGNSSASGDSGGGAILIQGPIGTVAIARSHFVGNQASSATTGGGGAIANASTPTGTFSISFSRFAGNTAAVPANGKTLANTGGALSPGANDNWWGANVGPGANDVMGTTVSRWLQLRNSASPNPILVTQTTTLTADIFGRNTGGPVAASNLVGLSAFPVPAATIFSNAVLGTLSLASTQFVDGAASATYTAGGTGGNGGADATADSQTVTGPIAVYQPPSVTLQPTPQTACAGSTATFTAAANGFPVPSVQWQVSINGGVTFTDIPGATSTTLSFTAATGDNGSQYRAVFTNVVSTATSNPATLTVNVAPALTASPTNLTVNPGQTATFTAAASGTPTPTVQWQVSINGGVTFTDIPGATSTTLSFTAVVADNGKQYRAVFTNTCSTATTAAAILTVNLPPSVTVQPTNQTACAGSTATFTAAASGSPAPTVQWQVSINGGVTFTDIPGATSTTLSFTAAAGDNGNQYRAVFTNVAGTATSNAATLTIDTAPSVTTNPADLTVFAGQTATFTAAASGTPSPTVQWQVSTDGGVTFNDIPGATSTTLSFTATVGQNGYRYRAVFTNSCRPATTTAATLTVNTPVAVVAAVSGDATICAGRTTTIRADFTGTVPVDITWSDGFVQYGVNASPATRDVSPSATTVYTITAISNVAGPGTASGSATVTLDVTCLSYYTVTPCRLADTRNPDGPSGGPALLANASRNFPVAGICSIPPGAKALHVVVTTVNQTDVGYLELYAAGGPVPPTSTINFGLNQARANNAVVTLGTNAEIAVKCVMPAGSTGTTNFILDVSGYFQ